MLSAFPISLPTDMMFGNSYPGFETGFTPWDDNPEYYPNIQSPEPVISNSGSDAFQSAKSEPDAFLSPKQVNSSSGSGSDEPSQNPNRNHANSDDPKPKREVGLGVIDERKRRRMISNRESARRSRMRKQKHLENLRNQVNRFRVENRELSNRLRLVLFHCHSVHTENNQLRSEYDMLRHKLSEIRQILVFRQLQQFTTAWPCNTTTVTSEQNPSIIQ
jgi:hypothetical protein